MGLVRQPIRPLADAITAVSAPVCPVGAMTALVFGHRSHETDQLGPILARPRF